MEAQGPAGIPVLVSDVISVSCSWGNIFRFLFLFVPGESHALHFFRLPVCAPGVFTAQDAVNEEIGQPDLCMPDRGMDQAGRYVYHAGLIYDVYFSVVTQVQLAFAVKLCQVIGTGNEAEDFVEVMAVSWLQPFERLADVGEPDLEVVLLIIEGIKHHGFLRWVDILVMHVIRKKIVVFLLGHFS